MCACAIATYAAQPDITGRVVCNGKPMANVVVTDGYDCVLTDANGNYTLEGKRDVRFVYVSTPAGYLPMSNGSTPKFYTPIEQGRSTYDFILKHNPHNDNHHLFVLQADAQVMAIENVADYGRYMRDVQNYVASIRGKRDVFGIDCGDLVGDNASLFEPYTAATDSAIDFPMYRVIGNHDMTYGGRSFETSYSTFESHYGPIYYSFNRGKAHYIVIDNNFYLDRDYQYVGYIDERTFRWMEQDLKYVPKGSLIFVAMHIPTSSTKKLVWNALLQDETSNAQGLYDILKDYNAHLLTGHSHFNLNVCFNDSLMEHNTAAVCGMWWRAPICQDGTPQGCGVYEVDGDKVKWIYKSAGYDADYQMRAYAVGQSEECPDAIVANVWNYDDSWKVEWLEDGVLMGTMEQFTGFDPEATAICRDRKRVKYEWIQPLKTTHLFKAVPKNLKAKIEVRVTDRFGRVYRQLVNSNSITNISDKH